MEVTLVKPQGQEAQAELAHMIEATGLQAKSDPYSVGESEYWFIGADGVAVGYIGINSVDFPSRRCRAFLWLKPESRYNGVGLGALEKLKVLLFDTLNMNRVEWAIDMKNEACLKLIEKTGFKQEGVARQVAYYDGEYKDYGLYAVLRSDLDKNGGK